MVQLLQAPVDQLGVTFNLSGGGREAPGGPFYCQYRVLSEDLKPQLSDPSEVVNVSYPGKTLLPAFAAHSSIGSPLSLCPCCSLCLEASVERARPPAVQGSLTFIAEFSQSSHAMGSAMLPILQIRKLRHK